jgi:hypothetical protein
MTEPFDMNKFYANEYWHKGSGLLLWNMRKLTAIILEISNPDTPLPFITTLDADYPADKWTSLMAGWSNAPHTAEIEETLEIELEGESFIISIMRITNIPGEKLKVEHVSWNEFGFDGKEDKGWDGFEEAIIVAREWLETNRDALKKQKRENALKKLFNIE